MSSKVQIDRVAGARSVREFVRLPFEIYARCAQWVPWFDGDVRALVKKKHPYFERNDGEYFVARRDGAVRGRLGVFENRSYNETHQVRHAQFYFFDAFEDAEVADALFAAACSWARARGLTALTGPMGFGAVSGGGILIEGFEHRAAMTMMGYNYPYYSRMLEGLGFEPFLDLFSYHIDAESFRLPDRIRSVAEKVLARGSFKVQRFTSKRELRAVASTLGNVYNRSLSDHPENYEMTEAELDRVTKDLLLVADPSLIKILTYKDEVVGFLFGFPDLSEALRRSRGRLNPWTILSVLRELRKTKSLIINGAGILPAYQRLGGNALLYYELERTTRAGGRFADVELTQIAQTTGLMLSDVDTIGSTSRYKVHRVYTLAL